MSFKVIGIGEVLWDMLPSGPQMGGAPANFAYHAHVLGARSRVITRVGDDPYGHEIKRRLAEMDIASDLVQTDASHPTGTVTVELSPNGIPEYMIHEDVAWDHLAASPVALAAVAGADAICFGTLAQRGVPARRSIQQLVAATPESALRIFDINLRQSYYDQDVIETSLNLANVLKLNDGELPVLARLFGCTGRDREQVESLAQRFQLKMVALTCGVDGSLLYCDGEWSECAAGRIEVTDTVGAGDSFTAALTIGLLRGLALDQINTAANQVAAYVCTRAGATPRIPADLVQLFRQPYLKGASPTKVPSVATSK